MRLTEGQLQAVLRGGQVRLIEGTRGQVPATGISEAAFQAAILRVARQHGWLAFHAYSMKRSPEGFPDLCLVKETAVIIAELKVSAAVVPTAAQKAWLRAFVHSRRVETYLWSPNHFEAIVARLTR